MTEIILPDKLEELRDLQRWVCWQYEPDQRDPEKLRKVPKDPVTGFNASSTDPKTWSTFPAAVKQYHKKNYSGIGFVLGDGYFGVDLDHVKRDGRLSFTPEARDIINLMASYTEFSPSGTGVHILCKGSLPEVHRNKSGKKGTGSDGKEIEYEIYDSGRYFTFTGDRILDSVIQERSAEARTLLRKYFGSNTESTAEPASIAEALDKDEKLRQLWNGDLSEYGGDHSRADAALVYKLLHLTGCDVLRTDQLFRQSALYRDKWDQMHGSQTYGAMTINNAVKDFKTAEISPKEAESEPKRSILDKVLSFSQIEEKPIEWLIPGYIPKGSITVLAGTGGTRKSSILVQLAAAISSGNEWIVSGTKASPEPQRVLYLSGEDEPEKVIKKRLSAYAGIQENIFTVSQGCEEFKDLKTQSGMFRELIEELKPALVILDPIQSFLYERIDMTRRNAMRSALTPLLEFGHRFGTAFIIVVHTNKRETAFGRGRISDSSDIWDIARAVYITGETEQPQRWYISNEKNSYSELAKTAEFCVENDRISVLDRNTNRDRFYVQQQFKEQPRSYPAVALEEAKEFITDYLDDLKGEHTIFRDILTAGSNSGISAATMKRAKTELMAEGTISGKRISEGKGKGVQLEIWKNEE